MLSSYEKSNIAEMIRSGNYGIRKFDPVLIFFLCAVSIITAYRAIWLHGASITDMGNKDIQGAYLYAFWAFALYTERRYRMAIEYATKIARGEVKASFVYSFPMPPITWLVLIPTIILWIMFVFYR